MVIVLQLKVVRAYNVEINLSDFWSFNDLIRNVWLVVRAVSALESVTKTR